MLTEFLEKRKDGDLLMQQHSVSRDDEVEVSLEGGNVFNRQHQMSARRQVVHLIHCVEQRLHGRPCSVGLRSVEQSKGMDLKEKRFKKKKIGTTTDDAQTVLGAATHIIPPR